MLEIAALSSLAPIVSGVIGHISSSLEASKTKREVEAAAAAADVNLERGYKLLRESLAGLVELLAVNLVKRPELQAATFRSLVDLRLYVPFAHGARSSKKFDGHADPGIDWCGMWRKRRKGIAHGSSNRLGYRSRATGRWPQAFWLRYRDGNR